MVQRVIAQVTNTISKSELEEIAKKLDNYSASDITAVAAEACQLPVREI
jgi:SpoVK/Ycf46/Vps4 family AAA+-type ATPase